MQMSMQNLMPSTDLQKYILNKCRTAESKQVCRICKQTKWRTNRRTRTNFHTSDRHQDVAFNYNQARPNCVFYSFFCLFFFVHWSHAMHLCRTGSDPNKEVLLNRNAEAKIRQTNVDFDKNIEISITNKTDSAKVRPRVFSCFFLSPLQRETTHRSKIWCVDDHTWVRRGEEVLPLAPLSPWRQGWLPTWNQKPPINPICTDATKPTHKSTSLSHPSFNMVKNLLS